MKKCIILFVAICCLGTFSCKKEKQITASELFIAANIGTTTWQASPQTSTTKGDSLQVVGQNATSTLTFKMTFNGPGTYAIDAADATFTSSVTPTSPAILYKLDGTQINTVTVTQYDKVSNITQGSFQLHFVKVPGSSDPGNSLDLTNGRFWMQIPF